MLERLAILVLLVLLVAATWGLLRLWHGRRLERLRSTTPLADMVSPGRPAVLAFSTPNCAECRTRQSPALDRLAAALGDTLTLHRLSALEHPDLVAKLAILTVPATVVVNTDGSVHTVNLGYTDEILLAAQVRAAMAV